jgi:hypothetical protein
MDDGMIFATVQRRGGALWAPPARPRCPGPPLGNVAQVHRPGGSPKYERPRNEVLGRGSGKIGGIKRTLCDCHVAGSGYEGSELMVGHLVAVDLKCADGDPMGGRFLGVMGVRAHQERGPTNPDRSLGHAKTDWRVGHARTQIQSVQDSSVIFRT